MAPLLLLAVLPDFDYFAFWFFGIDSEPRFTHSLAFAACAAALVWVILNMATQREGRVAFVALLSAAGSHAVLDLLVGVHPVCVFWPLPLPELQSPIGLLPSAGRLSLTNFYFWRNLLIECGVLFPLLACWVAIRREVARRLLLTWGAVLLPLWLASLIWSIKVHG